MPRHAGEFQIEIVESRWSVSFTIKDADGDIVEKYIASADRGLADSGIWFGTAEEYQEEAASAF